jgi:penicillin V acylase-like amidase (Ntn superfamily)
VKDEKSGDSVMNVYDNKVGVATNDPVFDWQLINQMTSLIQFSEKQMKVKILLSFPQLSCLNLSIASDKNYVVSSRKLA